MKLGPRIHPHLWFERAAREAAEFYCSLFPNSRIVRARTLRITPSGADARGWLKDHFGLSWQIVLAALDEMMHDSGPAALGRVTQAMLQMKKLDLTALRAGQTAPA